MLRRTVSRSRTTSWPATLAEPVVGSARVHRILMVVDLPAPFGPRKPNVSPAATSKSMPRTASISPYFLVSALTEIALTEIAGGIAVTPACLRLRRRYRCPLPRRPPREYGRRRGVITRGPFERHLPARTSQPGRPCV